MPSGLSQLARAVSAQMISVAGRPQNSADNPRASWPSERSSSVLGDVIGGNYEGRMMNDETHLTREQPVLENHRSCKVSNLAYWRKQSLVAKRLECGRFTAGFARRDGWWFVKFCALESAAQAGAVQTLREFGGAGG